MQLVLDEKQLSRLFPAFLAVDGAMNLSAVGPVVARLVPEARAGTPILDHFGWTGNDLPRDLARIAGEGQYIQLRPLNGSLSLEGCVVPSGSGFFLALNVVPGTADASEVPLTMSDFGLADTGVQAQTLLMLQQGLLRESHEAARDLARERQRSLDQLERFSRIAGHMAHEFNNLLSIVRLNLDRLARSLVLADAERRLIGILFETVERGSDMTRSLMTLAHQKHDSRVPLSVDAIIQENRAFLSTVAGTRTRLAVRLGAPDAVVEASRTDLLNGLVALLVNARDAMPDGGVVSLSTGVRKATLRLSDHAPAHEVACLAIQVEDNGIGMDGEVLSRAFDPLFSTKPDGRGIGLASVLEFARECGGDACLDSVPGQGTTAHIYLPLSLADGEPGRGAAEAQTTGARILVVEDEPYALEALSEMLEFEGFAVTQALDATSALAALGAGAHDLLLSDVMLPDLGGLELAARVSEIEPATGIVLMSGYIPDGGDLRPEWRFIRKPIDMGRLLELLAEALHEARSARP